MNPQDKPIAGGLTAFQWVELLQGKKPSDAQRAINFFDGEQEVEMIKVLNDAYKGRQNWKSRGMVPRYRNITRMIVEKSGRLFMSGLPQFDIFRAQQTDADEDLNKILAEEIAKVEFHETLTQFDQIVRLLKTGLMLVQYDTAQKKMVLDILHRGNAAVQISPVTKEVTSMIYRVSEEDNVSAYRVFSAEEIIDLVVTTNTGKNAQITVTNTEPNLYGIVPVVAFYDTTIPRSGFWVDGGQDLIQVNEMVNMHLTDSEWALSFAKRPTVVTNMKLAGNTNSYDTIDGQPSDEKILTGPDQVIYVDSMGVDSPFYEYKVPQVDVKPMDEVVSGWTTALAHDWSVNLRNDSNSRATSGFQLVVEGLDNKELRIQRQRMFEQGFKRFFRVLRQVLKVANGRDVFPEDSELFVSFADDKLPVDDKENEELWSLKIAEGRGSVISYLMDTHGITREEAIDLALQYKEDQELLTPKQEPTTTDVDAAKLQLDDAIALHEQHMNGSAPTTGPEGEKSQQLMMDQMVNARKALGGDNKEMNNMKM